jgi:outer membrane protein assembly factor BamB
MAQPKALYIGIHGAVLALDGATGQELWRTLLKGSDFVNVVLDGGDLLAATHGELFCLDPSTGSIRWRNPLKGLGWGLVSIAGNQQSVVLRARKQQEEAAATAAAAGA